MTTAPDIFDDVDESATREHARGQIAAVLMHTEHATAILDELRLAAENLRSIHDRAMTAIDELPAYNVHEPAAAEGRYADPQAEARISPTILTLLGSFGAPKVNDLVAGVDATQAALRRYADVASGDFDREWGPKGWEPVDEVKARIFANRFGFGDDTCPVDDCDEKGAHAVVAMDLTESGSRLVHLRDRDTPPPPPSGESECCASGSCEVCRGVAL